MAASFWATVRGERPADRADRVQALMAAAEARRASADYDTGSILACEAETLWGLADYIKAQRVIEVGTFIGLSTTALASAETVTDVYTCDASNDCLDGDGVIWTHPKTASTQMFKSLVATHVTADLCFFDGTLAAADVPLLKRVTHQNTVFVVHDYNYGPKQRRGGLVTVPRKGIGNIALLAPMAASRVLVEPEPGTTLAALVPKGMA